MKELKDYQPLYLGCEVIGYYQAKDIDTGKEVIVELKKRLVRVDEDGTAWLTGNIRIKEFKLVLRPLSDMNKEEVAELLDVDANAVVVRGNFCSPFFQIEYIDQEGEDTFDHRYLTQLSPDQVVYLLTKRFDLFGLIEAGLAIDKTSLT